MKKPINAGTLRQIKPRALGDLYRKALDAGCEVSITGSNHIRVDTPEGPVFGSRTSSDHRAVRNTRSQLRRKGVQL